MPHLLLPGHRLFYQIDDGDIDETTSKPWLVFCNSLGTDLTMWDLQVEELSATYRILRYDRRGHGRSTAPRSPYTVAELGTDVLSLLDALKITKTHFCGLSVGGLTGLWLCLNAPDRMDRVILCATAAKIGSVEGWKARMDAVRAEGLAGLASVTSERWFSPAFAERDTGTVQRILDAFTATSIDGYLGCCAALADADLRADISRIENPILAISGEEDPVCPPSDLLQIAAAVKRGRHISLPGRHIVNVEAQAAFNAALSEFLITQTASE